MTKKLIVGIIVMISLALIVGYLAGSQHIPFSKSINLIYTQNFSSDSERFEKIDPISKEICPEFIRSSNQWNIQFLPTKFFGESYEQHDDEFKNYLSKSK